MVSVGKEETRMKKIKLGARLMGRIEYCWLLLTNPTFQAARDKRLAFYQYQQGKGYSNPCY